MGQPLALGLALATILTAGGPVRAAEEKENPQRWKPRVTAVTVFKNGLGFFLRQGAVPLRDGWCLSEAVPPALFGTFTVFPHDKGEKSVDIVSTGPGEVVEFDGADAPKDEASKRARLEACKFLKLQVAYRHDNTDRTASGQLVSVGPEYVVLQAESNTLAVLLQEIAKVQVLDKPLRTHVVADNGKPATEATLGMAYLRKGITWVPEYTLVMKDDATAELTLRGTIVNEAEDLVHCDVNLVVGVPHFLHTDYLDPIAIGQAIRTVGAAVVPREVMTQMMNRAAISNDMRADQFTPETPAPPRPRDLREATGNLPPLETAGASDFTVYTKKDLTLRVGEKAVVTLFVKTINVAHLYRWTVSGPLEHFFVLRNDTDTAWTTGPCLALSNGNPLSEDLLKYVPKAGRGEIPVTTAVNIAHDQKETESDRQFKAHQPSPNYFLDRVALEGKLTLRNFGDKDAPMEIDLRLPGKPLEASDDARIVIDTANLRLLEHTGSIAWRVTVKPGETKTLTYKYERYVPSQ